MNLPTFLVGLGRPSVEDGIAVGDHSTSTSGLTTDPRTTSTSGGLIETSQFSYNAYLSDAREAVRQRFEATQCWLYDYDGISPPPWPTKSNQQQQERLFLLNVIINIEYLNYYMYILQFRLHCFHFGRCSFC
jgi:hypothetical protein